MNIHIPRGTLQKLQRDAAFAVQAQLKLVLQSQFESIKKMMIDEFMNHPVTEEIMNGANSSNSSGTLNGYGNLYSFIGFEEMNDPISPIIDALESCTFTLDTRRNSEVSILITMPSAKNIFSKTPMPWANGRSWAKGIETGISGIGFYLQVYGFGRSDAGIQSKRKIRSMRFKNTPYISFLINKYYKKFNTIQYSSVTLK